MCCNVHTKENSMLSGQTNGMLRNPIRHCCLFPRAMSQVSYADFVPGCLRPWDLDECREGQILRHLGRFKIDVPLLTAGSLTVNGTIDTGTELEKNQSRTGKKPRQSRKGHRKKSERKPEQNRRRTGSVLG